MVGQWAQGNYAKFLMHLVCGLDAVLQVYVRRTQDDERLETSRR